MNSNKSNFQKVFAALMILLLTTSCVKKRSPIEGQGQNISDLVGINSLMNVTCEINTKEAKQRVNSSAAQKADLNSPQFGIRVWDKVNFETNCPLLIANGFDLIAPPNTKFQIKFLVDANNLTVYRMVPPELLSHTEVPYATREGNLFKVPIGGFPITGFYVIARSKNPDNRDTNVVVKKPVDNKNFRKATHFTVNKTVLKPFKATVKTDLFPKEYFKGQWFYGKTVVNTRFESGRVGALDNSDANFEPASKIEFETERTFLVAVNANIDERLRTKDHNLNLDTAVRIPAVNIDFRQIPQGAGLGLEEEELITKTPEDARYMSLKLADAQTLDSLAPDNIFLSFFSLFRRKLNELVIVKDLVVRDDYFSFTLEDRGADSETRYSFLRVLPTRLPYEPRSAFTEDMSQFGFFTSRKDYIQDDLVRTEDDVEKLTFINRFNPNGEIVYHFSTSSPKDKWVRDIGREAVALWQQAFKKAGIKTKIRLVEDDDQVLGDIRYNLINLNDGKVGGLIGYGPSLADSQTGEILSATANLYVQSQRDVILGQLRRHIGEAIGHRFDFTDPIHLDPALRKLSQIRLGMEAPLYDPTKGPGVTVLNPMVYNWGTDKKTGLPTFSPTPMPLVSDSDVRDVTDSKLQSFEMVYEKLAAATNIWSGNRVSGNDAFVADETATLKFIETSKECQGVRDLIAKYKDQGTPPSTDEMVATTHPCSVPITQFAATAAMVHEMGHNFGLRHNFMATNDSENFIPISSFDLKYIDLPKELQAPKSSSIMDYYEGDDGFQIYPGTYDMAALRYGYLGQVEARDGSIKAIDTKKPLEQNFAIHPYKFCTDEQNYYGTDTFCAQFDQGSSSAKMAQLTTNRLFRSLGSSYRYQSSRKDWNPIYELFGSTLRRGVTLKKHYDRWRILLSRELGNRKQYLQGMTVADYQKVVSQMLQGPNKAEVEDLLKARNQIILSLVDLAFMPNRYCLVETKEKQTLFVELSRVRMEMQRIGMTGRVTSCKDAGVSDYFALSGYTFKSEAGFDVGPGTYELDPNNFLKYDFVGIGPVRMISMWILTARFSPLKINSLQGFAPSMMDEPDVRLLVESLLETRVINGAFLNPNTVEMAKLPEARLFNASDIKKRVLNTAGVIQTNANYSVESEILAEMASLVKGSMSVPNDPNESGARVASYMTIRTNNPELFKERTKNSLGVNANLFLLTPYASNQSFASRIIDKFNEVEQQKALAQIPAVQVQELFKGVIGALVSQGVVLKAKGTTNLDFLKYFFAIQSMATSLKGQQVPLQALGMLTGMDQQAISPLSEELMQVAQAQGFDQNGFFAVVGKFVKGEQPITDQEKAVFAVMMKPFDVSIYPEGALPDAAGLQRRADQIVAVIQASGLAQQNSGLELDAQQDMLLQILIRFSN